MLFAPVVNSIITNADIEKKLNSRMIQIRKLPTGDELEDDNTSANTAATKPMIDNCLVERKTLRLLISVGRRFSDFICSKRSVKFKQIV